MLAEKEKAEGWISLFDGETLTGWGATGSAEAGSLMMAVFSAPFRAENTSIPKDTTITSYYHSTSNRAESQQRNFCPMGRFGGCSSERSRNSNLRYIRQGADR